MNDVSKKDIYSTSVRTKPNTFIGGVAGSINSKDLLAQKLAISVSRIKMFRIVNLDVEATIIGTYGIPSNCFIDNANLKHFIDKDRNVDILQNGSFVNCQNLSVLELYGLKSFSGGGLTKISNTKLTQLYFPELISISGNGSITNNSLLKKFDAPVATTWPNNSYTLAQNPALELVNIPKIQMIGNSSNRAGQHLFASGKVNSCVYNVGIGCATSDNGGIDVNLLYVINSRGATVNFIP